MEDTNEISGDALIESLRKTTTKLETHIENFKLVGPGLEGSIEIGFHYTLPNSDIPPNA